MWALAVTALGAVWLGLARRRAGSRWSHFLALCLVRLYARCWHGLTCGGPSRLPRHGPALVVANHTCSADAAFLQAVCPRPLSYLIAAEYYRYGWACGVFEANGSVPVRRNGCDVAVVRGALRRLKEGRILSVFPEGGLSNAGRPRPRRGKAGAAYLALKSRAPVYVVLIRHGPQTSDVLPAWLKPSKVRLDVGPPVDLSAYYGRPITRRLLEEVATLLMDRVAALRNGARSPRRTP